MAAPAEETNTRERLMMNYHELPWQHTWLAEAAGLVAGQVRGDSVLGDLLEVAPCVACPVAQGIAATSSLTSGQARLSRSHIVHDAHRSPGKL